MTDDKKIEQINARLFLTEVGDEVSKRRRNRRFPALSEDCSTLKRDPQYRTFLSFCGTNLMMLEVLNRSETTKIESAQTVKIGNLLEKNTREISDSKNRFCILR